MNIRRLSRRHTLLAICSAFASGPLALPSEAGSCADGDVAARAADALMAAARSGSPIAFARALRDYADMESNTIFALGKNRSLVPANRRAELVNATTNYISRTLNDYRLKFRAEPITIKGCSGGIVRSNMYFLGGKGNKPVDWRIKNGKVIDVNVQNIWLGQLLRTNFQDILDRNGNNINTLISELNR